MDSTHPAVVVAVGPDGSPAALRYAAAEALRQDRGLRLVHATGPVVDDPRTRRRRAEDAGLLLASVRARVETEVAGRVPVCAEAVVGAPVDALARVTLDSPLVVIGRRSSGRSRHRQLRSVAEALAAHLHAPVASVPDGWRPDPIRASVVVVGVDPARDSGDVQRAGFTEARRRGARLRLVSAWWRPTGADGRSPLGRVDESVGAELLGAEVVGSCAVLRTGYAEVPTEVVVVQAATTRALAAEAGTADLLVLGRHTPWLSAGSCLGPVARDLLDTASCPVLLTAVAAAQGIQVAPPTPRGA